MKASFARRAYERLLGYAPPKAAAYVDYFLVPALRRSWGGPFNGQEKRAAIVRDILGTCSFDAIVETGTYRGTTTAYLRQISPLPLYTVERERRHFEFARLRFRSDPAVHLYRADSRDALRSFSVELRDRVLFFYLVAHWHAELPIREELAIIASEWRQFVVMIDDFAVPHDPGYGFDDWGEGKRLTLADSGVQGTPDVSVFWPAAPASEETGERRGCVVLARGPAAAALAGVSSLRP